jgi:hypothetical protein
VRDLRHAADRGPVRCEDHRRHRQRHRDLHDVRMHHQEQRRRNDPLIVAVVQRRHVAGRWCSGDCVMVSGEVCVRLEPVMVIGVVVGQVDVGQRRADRAQLHHTHEYARDETVRHHAIVGGGREQSQATRPSGLLGRARRYRCVGCCDAVRLSFRSCYRGRKGGGT